LVEALPWQQPLVTVYGRQHPTPRLVCWVADPGCTYRYSGLVQAITPWTPELSQLRALLELELGVRFNSLLLNRYRHGADRMGWHADDEPELDPIAPIASLSLGASRSLRFRPKPRGRSSPGSASSHSRPGAAPGPGGPEAGSGRRLDGPEAQSPFAVELADGDLLVMDPPTQRHWQHALPVRARVSSERINLTFRLLRPRA
jgi:alkylated DNA repair dioxygenase AlkB